MPKLIDLRLNEFLDLTASNAPAPGGGSVAALAGAQAAALMAMVCRLTIGKKKYLEVEEEVKTALARLEELRAELQRLVDADTEAYNTFGAALAMRKDTDEQKAARQAAMRAAARKSAEVPAQTLRVTAETARLIRELTLKANRNCLPDSGTAMQMALAAARGAAYNVRTNLPGTGDESFAKEFAALADRLEGEVADSAAAVHEEVRRLLSQ